MYGILTVCGAFAVKYFGTLVLQVYHDHMAVTLYTPKRFSIVHVCLV